jgi:hypothetical protein
MLMGHARTSIPPKKNLVLRTANCSSVDSAIVIGLAALKPPMDFCRHVLVSCDAGCLMHIAGRLHRQGDTLRVMHLAELLNTRGQTEERRRASGD